ncbi:MAG: biotin-dependent carboxyltransferase family protein [Nocardioides sp.]
MTLEVRAVGVSVLVQDSGRPGWAHLGVPRAGALDAPSAAFANRLVGNDPSAACLEVLLGGLELVSDRSVWVAVTGAPCPVEVDGRAVGVLAPVRLVAGVVLRLGVPERGLRSYLAVAGGIAVDPVLGSRSTDTLGGVGPAPVIAGDRLPVGSPTAAPATVDTPRSPTPGPLRLVPGPRAGHVEGDVVERLCGASYTVSPDSDRVALRLLGNPLPMARHDELPSEGIVLGAVQVPPDGRPLVFLADHPTTGGYPVVAVVDQEDLWQCAQLRPGERVGFARSGGRPGLTRAARH